ncbi:cation antiporter [Thioalkalivibrio nitratireducens DSM 14787]|uniref:Cation antiporter n=1 Tax=Thioalkalivibrio nitratireducens (strain DSM 14787 / UNIQEM 213 / ALEN2) TaxID=1255043 RepID=L0DS49_THIND|nr:Na+/H+ antiporter subunit E [Thioalkalivibrio nitratireducens]AGA31812.1 cation antiporter [Thioalkalivibrio nitratireducens DSM 14787]
MAEHSQRVGRIRRVSAFLLRVGFLLVIWWILTGSGSDWWFGFPLALAAAALSLWLTPPATYRLRPLRFPGFAVFFLWQSLLAGWDVARRTLDPKLPLQPDVLQLPLGLPAGAPTWWLMLTISLLPGTLSVRLHQQRVLEVHCLDARLDVAGSVRDTECQIARLYGLGPDTLERLDPR